MSNPYAPPEDRPRAAAPDDGGPDAARPGTAPTSDAPAAPGDASTSAPAARPTGASTTGLRPVPTEAERREAAAAPPDPVGTLKAAEQSRTVGVLLLGSVLVATLPMPWRVAAALFALAGLVLGVRALVTAVRARARGGLPAMLAVLVTMSAVWSLAVLTALSISPLLQEREDCMAGALTITAQKQCEHAFTDGLQRPTPGGDAG
ncbi:hypothetical protein GXP71_10760 [Cellulomonas sp. H30R-01]|uniref:hypothetical protein n=1 Tax=Cellulomonas sp. H30R-01 TaxID=2704467 RepID=UPI00138CFBD4|nr:hypothetical protein [Cellulomonas sp. H30R-01]QHT56505.1 hypothetical protein GXP71_10760 [Cellulomonas sp. H30R-01]